MCFVKIFRSLSAALYNVSFSLLAGIIRVICASPDFTQFWRGMFARGRWARMIRGCFQLTATFVWPYQRDPRAQALRPGR